MRESQHKSSSSLETCMNQVTCVDASRSQNEYEVFKNMARALHISLARLQLNVNVEKNILLVYQRVSGIVTIQPMLTRRAGKSHLIKLAMMCQM